MVVVGVTSAHLTIPVERETYLVELLTIVVDISHSGHLRVLTCLNGILLSGKSVGVVAHRVEHVESVETLVACIDIACYVAKRVTNMKTCARRVGEHVEHIEFLAFRVLSDLVGLLFNPVFLPSFLDVSKVVFHYI